MMKGHLFFGSYPSLRVAYIDEVEEPSKDRNKKIEKVYYSALVKAAVTKPDDPGQKLDQVLNTLYIQIILSIYYSFLLLHLCILILVSLRHLCA